MIGVGCILWSRAGDGELNDSPYLVLQVNDVEPFYTTYPHFKRGTIDFVCLETAERMTLEQPTIARLIRDQLAYFTGDVG